jgi:site-specific DNA recombinase
VVEEYVDAGASARSADRDGLKAMLARLADGSLPSVDYVIVHKLDRLARDRADDVAILLAIRKSGAALASVSEQIDETR